MKLVTISRLSALFAVAALVLLAVPAPRAQALSLATPGIAASNGADDLGMTTQVHWRHYHHRHWRRHYYYHHRHYWHPHRHYYHHRHYRYY